MKKTRALIHTTYREDSFELWDFFQFKDLARRQGVTASEHTMLCGPKLYTQINNVMIDYVKVVSDKYDDIPAFFDDLMPSKAFVLKANGILYYIYLIKGLPDWTSIIMYDRVDILTEKFW